MIRIEIKGIDQLEAKFKMLGRDGDKALQKALDGSALNSEGVMKTATPVKTARLRSSIHWESENTKAFTYKDNQMNGFNGNFYFRIRGIGVAIGTNVDYAIIVNNGINKVIKPVHKKALAWGKNLGGGKKEFVRKSVHLRIKPYKFFEAGVAELQRQVPIRMQKEYHKLLESNAKL